MKASGHRRYFGWSITTIGFIVLTIIASLSAGLFVTLVRAIGVVWSMGDTVGALGFRLTLYGFAIALLIGVPYLVFRSKVLSRSVLGISRMPTFKDAALSLAGVAAYAAMTLCVQFLLYKIPGFDGSQTQNLGVSTRLIGSELIAAYLVFVVAAPIAEELLFRGILYGRLKAQNMGAWATAVVVSTLFWLALVEWNVGIGVFCMSMVACYLREVSGTIWPGVTLHILKNALAFWFVFVVSQPIAG